jgi:hypothetical protein
MLAKKAPPSTKPTSDSLIKRIVIRLSGRAVLLIRPVQLITSIRQAGGILSILADEIHTHPVITVLIDDPRNRQSNLVHLKLGLVLKLLTQRPLPRCTSNRGKAPILQTLQPLVPQCTLNPIKRLQRILMDIDQPLLIRNACHVIYLQICWCCWLLAVGWLCFG